MARRIPSTTALAAFEAAARHQSFSLAAQELSVTQSAVCRQIALLEDFVGVRLFRRTRRGVLLTEAGTDYSRSVRARLDEVERDTLALMARGEHGGELELGVVPTFATQWLVPRLPDFTRQHPGVTVHLSSRTRPFLFEDSGLDAALHAGTPAAWPGTDAHFLMAETLVAVVSPRLLAAGQAHDARALAGLPLLQASTRPQAWRQCLEALGLPTDRARSGPRMELFSMLIEAAVHGLGAALVPGLMVEAECADGRLVSLLPEPLPSDRAYYLICPKQRQPGAALVALRDWLLRQCAPQAGTLS
ncbi:LysR family glycine cleavage system transcriptional activator [Sphaerotilus hippei]|uniref:LysR family glycine cleavage system transcriptional activator n=1 Tax=Sphaerotilus hippei TaxID=744406 RepID=A0A318HBU1_9BURK|nr:LysR family transcriptional regulator [Sphaerotilus hippei]PXW96571.1 LysR family glycine cleavage system transcriptional activator [Sphaerotilus hippei]